MTDKNTGGPAFSQPAVISDTGDILTSLNFDEGGLISQSLGTALGSEPKIGAIYAYAMADEMIKERSK